MERWSRTNRPMRCGLKNIYAVISPPHPRAGHSLYLPTPFEHCWHLSVYISRGGSFLVVLLVPLILRTRVTLRFQYIRHYELGASGGWGGRAGFEHNGMHMNDRLCREQVTVCVSEEISPRTSPQLTPLPCVVENTPCHAADVHYPYYYIITMQRLIQGPCNRSVTHNCDL